MTDPALEAIRTAKADLEGRMKELGHALDLLSDAEAALVGGAPRASVNGGAPLAESKRAAASVRRQRKLNPKAPATRVLDALTKAGGQLQQKDLAKAAEFNHTGQLTKVLQDLEKAGTVERKIMNDGNSRMVSLKDARFAKEEAPVK